MAEYKGIIDYGALLNEAMYEVIRNALHYVEDDCLPGEHFFKISFLTNFRGVKISDVLRQQYPNDLTIVLQYQFINLIVEEDRFSVTLSFNNRKERICVPYQAILSFSDPSTNIELSFIPIQEEDQIYRDSNLSLDMKQSKDSISLKQKDNVLYLDEFRKK